MPLCARNSGCLGRSASGQIRTHAPHKIAETNGNILVVPDPRHHLFGMPILAQLASDHVLDMAYEWLCRRRRDYSANSDVWALECAPEVCFGPIADIRFEAQYS
jgi:hypothetical protein